MPASALAPFADHSAHFEGAFGDHAGSLRSRNHVGERAAAEAFRVGTDVRVEIRSPCCLSGIERGAFGLVLILVKLIDGLRENVLPRRNRAPIAFSKAECRARR